MTWIDIIVWIAYICTLYVMIYWVLLYLEGAYAHTRALPKKRLKTFPELSVIVPAYNEEEGIAKTLESLLHLDYPEDKLRIIIVNDGSKDKTADIAKTYARTHTQIDYYYQKNGGKASALNKGLKKVTSPYFACLDADSFVHPGAAKAMVRSFEADPTLQITTPVMQVAQPKTFMQKFQRLEYLAAMLLVKMMSFIDGSYVAPGPFSMYRTQTIKDLGGFDITNLVEDQEIAYRVQEHHGKIRQVESAIVETMSPTTFKELRKQRNRWMKGTLLNIFKYRRMMFNAAYGDFGSFIMPLTLVTFFLALLALITVGVITVYPIFVDLHELYLIGFDILPYLNDFQLSFHPLDANYTSVLMIWVMLGISIFLTFLSSRYYEDDLTRYGKWYILPYFFIYFLILSIIAVQVMLELAIGKRRQKW